MNKNVAKYVLNIVTLMIAIFMLLSLLFPLISVNIDMKVINVEFKNLTSKNGFDFISNFSTFMDNSNWTIKLGCIVCILQLIVSIVLIIGNLFASFILDEDKVKKVSIITIIISLFFALMLVISGIFIVSELSNTIGTNIGNSADGVVKISTLSYIPIIIDIVFVLLFFVCNMLSKAGFFEKKEKDVNQNFNTAPTNTLTTNMLRTYRELYEKGALTEEEYLELKRKLLINIK